MVVMLEGIAKIAPRTFFEDALGLAAICVIIFSSLHLPALT